MRRAHGYALASLLALAAGAPSCTTETTAAVVQGCSQATPSFRIISPADGVCVEVSDGADAFVPVVVTTEGFLLRPPGTCETCTNCGYLSLQVDGKDNNTSTTAIVDMLFAGKVASHYGEFELTVTLMGNDGLPFVPLGPDAGADAGSTSEPLTSTVRITTRKKGECPATTTDAGG